MAVHVSLIITLFLVLKGMAQSIDQLMGLKHTTELDFSGKGKDQARRKFDYSVKVF